MKKKLKAVLFDMDGVLFDSMPYHSEAWHTVMKSHGLTLSREEAYMHEGRTGASTINIVFQRELGREATQEEIEVSIRRKVFCSIHIPKQSLCRCMGVTAKSEEGRADSDGGHRLRSVISARTAGTQLSGNVSQRTDGYSVRCKIW